MNMIFLVPRVGYVSSLHPTFLPNFGMAISGAQWGILWDNPVISPIKNDECVQYPRPSRLFLPSFRGEITYRP